MTSRARALVVGALVGVVAVRVSVSQPVGPSVARIASDPGAALRDAADGWTVEGTLGGASAQGLRDVPLAAGHWLGSQLGLSPAVLQTSWRVLVLLLALWGAIRLARALSPDGDSWTPWVAAVLFSCGPVLVAAVQASPLDGLAAATLPWVVGPLLVRGLDWRSAAASAVWLGVAGFGSPGWALAALVAGLVAVAARSRGEILPALRWLALGAASSAWWVAAYLWEHAHARDVSALAPDQGLRAALAEGVGRPGLALLVLVAVAAGPLIVPAAALLLRPPGTDPVFLGGLLGAVLIVTAGWGIGGWTLPAFAPPGDSPLPPVLGPVLGWLGLAALVAWTPLISHLTARVPLGALRERALSRRQLAELTVGVVVVLSASAGLAAAAAEREPLGEDRPGLEAQLATWSREAPSGRVLVLPAQSYERLGASWGAALGARPWVGRTSLPASGAAGTAALDEAIQRLSRGDAGPGTREALRRLGVVHVLVHLGETTASNSAIPMALVRSALTGQGARLDAVLAGSEAPSQQLLDLGVRSATHRVEIWSLPKTADGAVHPGAPVDVVGDAGTVGDLADAGVLDSRAVRLQGESSRDTDVLSDSARRRDVDQRVPGDPYGPDLGAEGPRTVVPADAAPTTTAVRRLTGARSVTASSSAAELGVVHRRAGADALAAADANAFTAWHSRPGTGRGQWWAIDLPAPVDLAGTSVQLVMNPFAGHRPTRVQVTTDHGSSEQAVPVDGLVTLAASTRSAYLRITVSDVDGTTAPRDSVGISEVTIPGVTVRHRLVVAGPPTTAWLLGARRGSSVQCVPAVTTATTSDAGDLPVVCNRGVSVEGRDAGPLSRVLAVDESSSVAGLVWARAADSAEAAALAERLGRPSVVAAGSTVAASDLVTRPQAAVDDDTSTAWRPAPEDQAPTLTLTWSDPTAVSGLRLAWPEGNIGSVPTRVRVTAQPVEPGGVPTTTETPVGTDGVVRVPSVRTRQVVLTVLEDTGVTSVDSLTGTLRHVPVALAEVELMGGPLVRYDAFETRELRCGTGPEVVVDGRAVETRIATSAHEIVTGGSVRASLCATVPLRAGEVEVDVPASYLWVPLGLFLSRSGGPLHQGDEMWVASSSQTSRPLQARVLGSAGRRPHAVDLGDASEARTVALAVPADTGWEARSDRGRLESVTVDGWAQAWAVPAGVSGIELHYAPGGSLRGWAGAGLGGWLVTALLMALGSLSGVRRRGGPGRRGDGPPV